MVEKEELIKTAMIAEYDQMRTEILQRIRGQGQSAAGVVALISGFIGVLATVNITGGSSLVASLFIDNNEEAIKVFAFLCSGLVLGIIILSLFWAYQLFIIFRINRYLQSLAHRYRNAFDIDEDIFIFDWPSYSSSDINDSMLFQIVKKLQPLLLFVTGLLGLAGVSWGVLSQIGWGKLLPSGITLIVIFSLLALSFILTWLIFFALHKKLG